MQSSQGALLTSDHAAELAGVAPHLADALAKLNAKVDDIHRMVAGKTKSHFTVEEIAEQTGRSAYTVRRWISEGLITATRVSAGGPRGRLLIAAAELAKLVGDGKGSSL